MTVTLRYFAWVREAIGHGEEAAELPADVTSVGALIVHLAERTGGYQQAFADPSRLRFAVDQVMANSASSIVGAREVAVFPPVTGG